jgi:regulator of replication initiation timing
MSYTTNRESNNPNDKYQHTDLGSYCDYRDDQDPDYYSDVDEKNVESGHTKDGHTKDGHTKDEYTDVDEYAEDEDADDAVKTPNYKKLLTIACRKLADARYDTKEQIRVLQNQIEQLQLEINQMHKYNQDITEQVQRYKDIYLRTSDISLLRKDKNNTLRIENDHLREQLRKHIHKRGN